MRSFAIVIRRAYFEAKKRRNYAKNVVVNRSGSRSNDKDVNRICNNSLSRLNQNFLVIVINTKKNNVCIIL